jgi:hypothetical protein
VDPVPDPLLLRKNLVAPGIEPGPLNLWPGTLTTRPQRRSFSPFTLFWKVKVGLCDLHAVCVSVYSYPSINFWMPEPIFMKLGMYNMTPEPISVAYFVNPSQCQSYVTTDGQSASLSWRQAPIWGPRPDLYYCHRGARLMWGALSDKRTGLSFTIAAGSRQQSHSRVRVPRDSWPYFTVSHSRLPQSGGPGPHIYIPQAPGSIFVASYDSQGCGGGIRTLLHARVNPSQSQELLYDWRFMANQFVLAPSPLRITSRDFLTETLRS